jgi:oxygen-dependent protoporphyrinogen oxidase
VRRIRERVEACPGLALAGNSYEGVGIPDCIFSGQQAAEKIWKELASMAGAKQARSAANSG